MIVKFTDPRLPQFAFEWHPRTGKVYRIDLPGSWIDGQFVPQGLVANGRCIAEHVDTHGRAFGFVQTFCRGYLLAVAHHEQGQLDSLAPPAIKETDSCPIR